MENFVGADVSCKRRDGGVGVERKGVFCSLDVAVFWDFEGLGEEEMGICGCDGCFGIDVEER